MYNLQWLQQLSPAIALIPASLWVLFLLVGASGYGYYILHRLEKALHHTSVINKGLPCVILGIGSLGQVFFILAHAGIFYLSIIIIITLTGCLFWFALSEPFRHKTVFEKDSFKGWALLFWVLAAVPLLFLLLPEAHFDAIRTHLWMAHRMVLTHRFPVDLSNWNTLIPNIGAVVFGMAYSVGGEIGAKLSHFVSGILTALLIINFWKEEIDTKVAYLAGVLFISVPVILWEMSTAYIDLFPLLFSTAFLLYLFKWHKTRNKVWFYISSLMLGFALCSKYNPFMWIPFAIMVIFSIELVNKSKAKVAVARTVLFILISLAIFLPWGIRNIIYTSNPLYPVPIFNIQQKYMSQKIINAVREEQKSFGIGQNPYKLLELPQYMLRNPRKFRGDFGIIAFAALLVIFLLPSRFKLVDYFLSAAFAYWIICWFFTSQEIRYAVYALPSAAWMGARMLYPSGEIKILVKKLWGVLITIHIILHLPGIYTIVAPAVPMQLIPKIEVFNVAFGLESYNKYLARHNPFYPVYKWACSNLGPDTRILSFDASNYWSCHPLLYAFSVEGDFTDTIYSPKKILRVCHLHCLTHVVVNNDWVRNIKDFSKASIFFNPSFQKKYLKPIFKYKNVVLFEIP